MAKSTTTTVTYEELRQRMLDGDKSVTQAQLTEAWERHESQARFESLQTEAAALAEARTAEEQRQADIAALAKRVEVANGDRIADLQAAYRAALEGMWALRGELEAYNADVAGLGREAQRLEADVVAPQPFEVGHEVEQLIKASRNQEIPHRKDPFGAPYPRLLDEEFVAAAEAAHEDQQKRAAQQDEQRRADLAETKRAHEEEQKQIAARKFRDLAGLA